MSTLLFTQVDGDGSVVLFLVILRNLVNQVRNWKNASVSLFFSKFSWSEASRGHQARHYHAVPDFRQSEEDGWSEIFQNCKNDLPKPHCQNQRQARWTELGTQKRWSVSLILQTFANVTHAVSSIFRLSLSLSLSLTHTHRQKFGCSFSGHHQTCKVHKHTHTHTNTHTQTHTHIDKHTLTNTHSQTHTHTFVMHSSMLMLHDGVSEVLGNCFPVQVQLSLGNTVSCFCFSSKNYEPPNVTESLL